MLFLRGWLQEYIEEELPPTEELVERIGTHAFEIESVKPYEDDFLIDVDVLPNRAHDALSYIGIAREVASVFSFTLKAPDMSFETEEYSTTEHITLDVEDSSLVRRATKKIIKGVNISESPEWLKQRLLAMGQRPINNIVDITNFVMYELGQPVHAFDFDKLKKGTDGRVNVHIRKARDGESIELLGGDEYKLGGDMLVIADDEKALDIAGIKGGSSSNIDENTKTIMISVCSFEPTNIRRTSLSLGLRTDASMRFEKDIAPELVPEALSRICHLIGEIVGVEISSDHLDIYPREMNPYRLGITVEKVNRVLGASLNDEDMANILMRLGLKYEKLIPREYANIKAPEYIDRPYLYGATVRSDAPERFDCSSFVAYLYAQAGVSIPRTSVDQYVFCTPIEKDEALPGDLVFSNTGHGNIWKETQVYMKGTPVPEGVDHVGMYLGDGKVIQATRYKNGVVLEMLQSSEQFKNIVGYRRVPESDMEQYVVEIPYYRLDLRIEEDIIEEIARVYGYQNIVEQPPYSGHGPVEINKEFYWTNKIKDILVDAGFSEVMNYTFVPNGDVQLQNSLSSEKSFLRNSLLDGVKMSRKLGNQNAPLLGSRDIKVFEIGTVFDNNGEHVELYASEDISGLLSDSLGVNVDAGAINISALIERLPEPGGYGDLKKLNFGGKKFSHISIYPFILRDIALWTPARDIDVKNKIESIIREKGGALVKSVVIFDEFRKDDRVSYAYRLVFQSDEKTLTDREVGEIMNSITNELISNDGWSVR